MSLNLLDILSTQQQPPSYNDVTSLYDAADKPTFDAVLKSPKQVEAPSDKSQSAPIVSSDNQPEDRSLVYRDSQPELEQSSVSDDTTLVQYLVTRAENEVPTQLDNLPLEDGLLEIVQEFVDSLLSGQSLAEEGVDQTLEYILSAPNGEALLNQQISAVVQSSGDAFSTLQRFAGALGVGQQQLQQGDQQQLSNATAKEDLTKLVSDVVGKIIKQAKLAVLKPELSNVTLQSEQAINVLKIGGIKPESEIKNAPKQDASQRLLGDLSSVDSEPLTKAFEQGKEQFGQHFDSGKNADNGQKDTQSLALNNNAQEKLKLSAEVLPQIQSAGVELGTDLVRSSQSSELHTSLTHNRFTMAKDVLAQIKFGVANSMGKDARNITIQLHPKELGSVDIRMELGQEGKTKIHVLAERTDTMNLLQKESSSLRNILQDALKTDSTNLSFTFHDKNDENWRQFYGDDFAKKGGHLPSDEDEVMNWSSAAASYAGGYLSISEGLDIRV